MICNKCGNIVGDQAHFCMYCGNPINQDEIQSNDAFLNSHLYDDQYSNDRKYKKKTRKNILLWLVLLGMIGLGIYYNHSNKPQATEMIVDQLLPDLNEESEGVLLETTTDQSYFSNIMNNGYAVVGYNHFYFVDANGNIVQANLDLTEKRIIVQGNCQYLSITDHYLVYSDETFAIHLFDLENGNDKTLLDFACYYVCVVDDLIYYQNDPDGESIYVYNITEDTNQAINEEQSYNIYIKENTLYYTTESSINKIDLATKEKTKLLDAHAYAITVYNEDTIFYLNDKDLCLHFYNVKENSDIALFDIPMVQYVYYDDKIYFEADENNNYVIGYYDLTSCEAYSYGIQGEHLQAIGDYVYYSDASKNVYLINSINGDKIDLSLDENGEIL